MGPGHGIEAGAVQCGEQRAAVAVAEVGLSPRRRCQAGHDRLHRTAGAVTAAGEPHRVVTFVVGDVEESLCACFVVAREMAA